MESKGKSIDKTVSRDSFSKLRAKVDFSCDFFFNVSFGDGKVSNYRFYKNDSRFFRKPDEREVVCYYSGLIENSFPVAATGKDGRLLYVEESFYDVFTSF